MAGSAELGFVKEEFLEVKLECQDEMETSGNGDHQTTAKQQGNKKKWGMDGQLSQLCYWNTVGQTCISIE